ncbi:MAG TPA: hypothetical protein VL048_18185 [Xanthobacteraceae bacterium]|nr:hypothetical protein [Xanthobacteraceae bacterium]
MRKGRPFAVSAVAAIALASAGVCGQAATRKPPQQPVVERSAAGTVIQPTTTIIPDGNGHRTIIIIPRHRSYLDTGTEVSVGDRSYRDYVLPPGGDPGRPNWYMGPDVQGKGGYPIAEPFYIPGLNPNTPF